MSTIPNPHWHCYLCRFGTGIITGYDSPLGNRFSQRRIRPSFSHSIDLRCFGQCLISVLWQIPLFLSGLHGKVFSLPTCLVGSSHEFLSFMCPKQCQYEHSWLSCSCLYLQSYCSHEQIEGLNCTKSSVTVLESSTALVSLDLSPCKSQGNS